MTYSNNIAFLKAFMLDFSIYILRNKLMVVACCARIKKKKNPILTASDLIKYLKLNKFQRLLHTGAPISELPSNIGTMDKLDNGSAELMN